MTTTIRPATSADEPFLWEMLFEAAHAGDDVAGPDDLRAVPALARYLDGWGRPGDLGVVAVDEGGTPLGAAWLRLLTGDDAGYGHVDDETPELAIATVPGRRAAGIGTRLLDGVVATARCRYPGVCLSVRADNPARRLYERAGFRSVPGSDMTNRVGSTSITMVLRF